MVSPTCSRASTRVGPSMAAIVAPALAQVCAAGAVRCQPSFCRTDWGTRRRPGARSRKVYWAGPVHGRDVPDPGGQAGPPGVLGHDAFSQCFLGAALYQADGAAAETGAGHPA